MSKFNVTIYGFLAHNPNRHFSKYRNLFHVKRKIYIIFW
jgi:hypothetical protein